MKKGFIKGFMHTIPAIIAAMIFASGAAYGRSKTEDKVEILELSTDVELDPCPMCGRKVRLKPINDSWYIECEKWGDQDGCGLSTGFFDNKEKLIKMWNNMDETMQYRLQEEETYLCQH